MTSLAFDRAAPYYDQTRALAPGHAAALNLALIEHGQLNAASRVLEVGVGTGRIAAPLLACGVPVIGLDLSRPMMALLRAKWPRSTLAQADATRLPLATGSFDAVVLVHVLHLVADWQAALLEVARVLRPGGRLLHAWRDREATAVGERLHTRFRELVEAQGERFGSRGSASPDEQAAFWAERGWLHTVVDVAEWQDTQTARTVIDQLASRQWSSTWTIRDETFATALAELEDWAAAELGDLQQPWPRRQRLVLDVVAPPS